MMKSEDIIKLLDAGYTKEEIKAMEIEPEVKPEQEQPEQEVKPEQEQPEQEVKPDDTSVRIEQMQNQINNLIKQMHLNNLKSASVNILPEDDLERKTDEAMAELIRPKYKEKEM